MTMESAVSGHWRSAFFGVAAALAPTLAFSIYLVVSRNLTRPLDTNLDYAGAAASIALGLVFILRLPLKGNLRILLALAFTAMSAAWLFFYGLYFVCTWFQACL